MAEAQKRQEAEEHLKTANKHLTKSFFRSVDFTEAASHFQMAGDAYRAAGDWDLAKKAFYQSIDAYVKDGCLLDPAENSEKVAKVVAQQLRDKNTSSADKLVLVVEAMRAFEAASGYYIQLEEVNRAGDALAKAAAVCDDNGMTKEPKELYARACAMVETTNQTWYAIDVFHKTLEFLVKLQLYTEAREIVTRQIEVFQHIDQHYNTVKCYVKELVLLLAMNDVAAADEAFTLQRQDEKFVESEEFALAEGLIQAYKSNDADLLKSTIRNKEFDQLDCKQISRLARKLTLFAGAEPSAP